MHLSEVPYTLNPKSYACVRQHETARLQGQGLKPKSLEAQLAFRVFGV